jgi:hypothetical protein
MVVKTLAQDFGSGAVLAKQKVDTSIYPVSGTDGDGLRSAAAFGGDF